MAQQDRPNSMRIRFEDNWHRLDAIEEAADLYERNRTDAVTLACEHMARLAGVLEDFLARKLPAGLDTESHGRHSPSSTAGHL
jgi:hypothetical protein